MNVILRRIYAIKNMIPSKVCSVNKEKVDLVK